MPSTTPNLGFKKYTLGEAWSSDPGDAINWDKADEAFSKNNAGDPNPGATELAGDYLGQKVWDTDNFMFWACDTVGAAGTAEWTAIGPAPKTIEMYNVAVAAGETDPPNGWLFCDGDNDTPDLRGRFIVGYHSSGGDADTDYDAIESDGKDPHGVDSNKAHPLTEAELPVLEHSDQEHAHKMFADEDASSGVFPLDNEHVARKRFASATLDYAVRVAPTQPATAWVGVTDLTDPVSGDHGGGASPPDADGHENRPPYYVLAYIIKTPV